MHVDDVVADFDEDVGVGLQVPVPGGVWSPPALEANTR